MFFAQTLTLDHDKMYEEGVYNKSVFVVLFVLIFGMPERN